MSAHDRSCYPKMAYYVRHNLPEILNVPVIASALRTIGQINERRLRIALTWDQFPTVKVADLVGALGEFTPDSNSNELRVDRRKVVEPFERGRGLVKTPKGRQVYLLGVTILHELVHWGDDQDGIDRAGEEGEEFERLVYGGVVD